MKLDYWGRFVEDDHNFAVHKLNGECSKLIVTLINDYEMLDHEICEWHNNSGLNKIDFINILNEYLNFNVEKFDDFKIDSKTVDIGNGDIKVPIWIFDSTDESCQYNMYLVGQPGELNYVLKNPISLDEAYNNNQGMLSFSVRAGEGLMFMKNYATNEYFCREEYVPGSRLSTDVFDLKYFVNNQHFSKYKICMSSAFQYSMAISQLNIYGCTCKISIREIEEGKYEISIRDCDGRPKETDTREGESLYSTYYQYMVEKGYFKDKDLAKTNTLK